MIRNFLTNKRTAKRSELDENQLLAELQYLLAQHAFDDVLAKINGQIIGHDPRFIFIRAQAMEATNHPDTDTVYQAAFKLWFEHNLLAPTLENHFSLGLCYQNGLGTEMDAVQAFKHFEQAGAGGHLGAQKHLGLSYMRQGHYTQALYWLRAAANQGDTSSMILVADLYQTGLEQPADLLQASFWYSLISTYPGISATDQEDARQHLQILLPNLSAEQANCLQQMLKVWQPRAQHIKQ